MVLNIRTFPGFAFLVFFEMAFALATDSNKWHDPDYGSSGGIIQYSFWTQHIGTEAFPYSQTLTAEMEIETRAAFARWASVANIDFQEVSDTAYTAQGGIRLGMASIDSSGNTEGLTKRAFNQNRSITAAEIAVNADTAWHFENGKLYDAEGNSFYHVILHEIGHALGLAHYDGASAIMNTVDNFLNDLQPSDIEGIQYLYGVRPPPPSNPETAILTDGYPSSGPAIAAIAGGGFVVAAESQGIKDVAFDVHGAALSGAIATVSGTFAAIAPLRSGYLTFAWENLQQGQYVAQVSDSLGNLVGSSFQFASGGGDFSSRVQVGQLANGNVIASYGAPHSFSGGYIGLSIFDQNTGAATTLTPITSTQNLESPDVAGLANGNAIVTWIQNPPGSSGYQVYGEIITRTGQAVGSPFAISSGNADFYDHVTALSTGGFFATWFASAASVYGGITRDGSGDAIMGRFFDANGNPLGSQFVVDTTTQGAQDSPTAVALPDGRLVVAWVSGGGYQIRARVFDLQGNALSDDFLVDSVNKLGTDSYPAIAALGNNDSVAISWGNTMLAGGVTTMYERVLDVSGYRATETLAQYQSAHPSAPASVAISDTGSAIQSLSVSAIAALSSAGAVASIDATDNAIAFSLAQYHALGTISLSWTDVVTLTDTSADVSGLNLAMSGINRADISGSAGSQSLLGGSGNDTLAGGAGNDAIYGGAGNDLLDGGSDNDVLVGGSGDDTGYGGDGNDYFYAGSGNDLLVGGGGLDVLLGESGDDTLYGGAGFNYLFGGDGNDVLIGAGGSEGSDVNVMQGDAGADVLYGGAGTNYFYGGTGVDTMFGGSGLNIFVSSGETDGNYIYGGSGQNYIYGSSGGDTVTGGSGVDVFLMGSGADQITGGGGVDYAWGGGGADTFNLTDTSQEIMVVQDFNSGGVNDIVNFAGTSLHSFTDVQAASFYSAGIKTTIISDAAGSAVWLIGIAPEQLDASMFKFS